MKKYILILIGFAFFISCDKNNTVDSTPDDKLLVLAYNKSYQYPDVFYHETNLIGNVYYENTVSIKPVNERDNSWIELNTNDKEQARTWSNLSNEYSSVDRKIVKENETEKYFEFVRVNILNDNDTLLSRVHRSGYFISLYNKFKDIDTIGMYNSDLSSDNTKELNEYLWRCGTLSIYDKVVESKTTNKRDHFEHHIQSLKTVYGDFGMNDMIYVYDNKFILNKTSRILTVKRQLIKEIKGNYHSMVEQINYPA